MSSLLVRRSALLMLLVACAGSEHRRSTPLAVAGSVRAALVVDECGEPVAGAEVAFLPASESLDLDDFTTDCELRFAAAPRAQSGSDGVVVLPTLAACVAAVVRHGDRFGAGELHFNDRSVALPKLGLAPDRHVTVHVRDEAGRPRAFVPIEVRAPASQWQHFRAWNVEHRGASDAEGRLTLWHAQRLCAWDPQRAAIELRAIVVGAETQFVPVNLAVLRADAVVLTCPPHGRLVVQRWLAPGIADGSEGRLWAWLVRDDNDGARPPQAFGDFPAVVAGPWRSWPVALGQLWRVQGDGMLRDVVGPVGDGESVRVDHVLEAPKPHGEKRVGVVVVLERPDGTPCADATVVLGDVLETQTGGVYRVRTDAHGRAQFVMTHWSRVEFTVVGENLCAERPLPSAAPAGVIDLGVVRLVAPRSLASGRCVDAETGLPVRACLHAFDEPWTWRTAIDGTFAMLDAPWTPRPAAGEMSVRVTPDWEWTARCFGYRERSLPIAIGSSNLELKLERTRVLRCMLRVDAAIGERALDVRVGDAGTRRWHEGRGWERSGRIDYVWAVPDDLRDPAAARLEVFSDDDDSPLAVVDGAAFRPTPDGFEVELDLRGALVEHDVFTDGIADMPFQGSWFVRTLGEQRWRRFGLMRHASLVVRRGSEVEVVFAPTRRPWHRRTLTHTLTRWRPSPGSTFAVTWDAPELPGTEFGVLVLLRQLADRGLAPVAASNDDEDADACLEREHRWPLAAELLSELQQQNRGGHLVRSSEPQEVSVWQLGHYVVVPYVVTPKGPHWFVDAAVPVEVARPGAKVEVAIRVDAAALRAAVGG